MAFGGVWKESLSELSGGQKSLLALSLILAMLLFKPAPIYILDEVRWLLNGKRGCALHVLSWPCCCSSPPPSTSWMKCAAAGSGLWRLPAQVATGCSTGCMEPAQFKPDAVPPPGACARCTAESAPRPCAVP